tara:strand:+ start:935 stop:2071 length:1137 start_codon:yes stop_codon:yes gene_type:complete
MPSFKPKTNKKIVIDKKNITTLDGKHEEILQNLNDDYDMMPELQIQIINLQNELKDSNTTIDTKLDLMDDIKKIKIQIRKIKNEKKNYLLNNSKYVFDYFENKKKISEEGGTNNTRILDSFFKVKTDNDVVSDEAKNSNQSIVNQYLSNIDTAFFDINNFIVNSDICKECKKGELIASEHEGVIICNNCSISSKYIIENDKPSYKEPPKEVCFYAYKRINHFREILAQFQAKESTQIPTEVLENIKLQIKKERILVEALTNKKAKEILKKLGYNKYYEHIPFIKDKLGIKPPIMSQELEETLCNLFMDIQAPYAKYCPDDRVNFLNYYYTVYKLCELLDQKMFLPFFPMLKDREKRIEQDEIWKNICYELDWEFIPTI